MACCGMDILVTFMMQSQRKGDSRCRASAVRSGLRCIKGKNSSHWRNLTRYTSASLGAGSGSLSNRRGGGVRLEGCVCDCDVVAASASESSRLIKGWHVDADDADEGISQFDAPFMGGGAGGCFWR